MIQITNACWKKSKKYFVGWLTSQIFLFIFYDGNNHKDHRVTVRLIVRVSSPVSHHPCPPVSLLASHISLYWMFPFVFACLTDCWPGELTGVCGLKSGPASTGHRPQFSPRKLRTRTRPECHKVAKVFFKVLILIHGEHLGILTHLD